MVHAVLPDPCTGTCGIGPPLLSLHKKMAPPLQQRDHRDDLSWRADEEAGQVRALDSLL